MAKKQITDIPIDELSTTPDDKIDYNHVYDDVDNMLNFADEAEKCETCGNYKTLCTCATSNDAADKLESIIDRAERRITSNLRRISEKERELDEIVIDFNRKEASLKKEIEMLSMQIGDIRGIVEDVDYDKAYDDMIESLLEDM
jgi:hypothetical protein